MKTKTMTKTMTKMMCVMLMLVMAFCVTGCNEKNAETPEVNEQKTDGAEEKTDSENTESTDNSTEPTVLGEGQTQFKLVVTDKDGNETYFEINTDRETVGEALLEHNLIEGEEGDYGLYIKTVNGITADFDADQTYWAFYIDGEYATSGVDTTTINAGSTYSLKVEK